MNATDLSPEEDFGEPSPWQAELNELAKKYADQPCGGIVFYGSSSIRLWPFLKQEFPGARIQNLGYGGSTLADCARQFGRIVVPRQPSALFLYGGDNDIALGASSSDVRDALEQLMDRRDAMPSPPRCFFLSIKFSPSRRAFDEVILTANEMCQGVISARANSTWVDVRTPMLNAEGDPQPELFMGDGLHLSRRGYMVWNDAIREAAGDILG